MEINPQLVLEAAKLAKPGREWCRPIIAGHPDYNNGQETVADYVAYFDYDGPKDLEIRFNPLTSDDDAMKLERALKKEGWHFSWNESFDFCATNLSKGFRHEMDPSDTLLLLKCVSAMKGIPLYSTPQREGV